MHTASAKGLLLACERRRALPPAHVGDPLRMRQIVSNFLSNAVKFTDVGGIEVEVRVLDDDDATTRRTSSPSRSRCTDTGIGLADEQRRRLFEEFAQAEAVDDAALRRNRSRSRDLSAAGHAHGWRGDDGKCGGPGHDDAPRPVAARRRSRAGRSRAHASARRARGEPADAESERGDSASAASCSSPRTTPSTGPSCSTSWTPSASAPTRPTTGYEALELFPSVATTPSCSPTSTCRG